MNRIAIATGVASFFVLAACATSNETAQLESGPSIEKPAVKTGDRWTYWKLDPVSGKEQEYATVVVVNASERAIQTIYKPAQGAQEHDEIWTPEWNTVANSAGDVFEPHDGALRFPLRVGATYRVGYEIRRAAGPAYVSQTADRHEGTARIVGWEEVRVPAGRFRALKIEIETWSRRLRTTTPMPPTKATKVIWYSPEIKRWVKATYIDVGYAHVGGPPDTWAFELVDYKVQ